MAFDDWMEGAYEERTHIPDDHDPDAWGDVAAHDEHPNACPDCGRIHVEEMMDDPESCEEAAAYWERQAQFADEDARVQQQERNNW